MEIFFYSLDIVLSNLVRCRLEGPIEFKPLSYKNQCDTQ